MNGLPPHATGIAAVRGAIAIANDSPESILAGTARLLQRLVRVNRIEPSAIVSALFTATEDLTSEFPAHAARKLGWSDVPLLCAREIAVPGAMPRVIRVLLTVSGIAPGRRLEPVYLDGAAALRPDLGDPGHPEDSSAGSIGLDASPGPDAEASSESRPTRRVALVGLGQIGGSIGLALGARGGWWRVGCDSNPETLARAVADRVIDEAANSVESCCAQADLAVLATPVDVLPALIDRAAAALPRGAALVDTGSARAGITPALERAATHGIVAAGGHPIAGNEGRGLDAARADLFHGAPFALIPVAGEVPERVRDLVRDLGARPVTVSASGHDHALARTSHLPYLLACALRAVGGSASREGLSGPGFRDATRVAASDPAVATAYCRANAREIGQAWRELRSELDRRVTELGG